MADLGHTVVGIDVDEEKVAALSAAKAPFYEPGLDDLLARALATGRLSFTSEFSAAVDADVHFICVGTPQRAGEFAADLTYVEAAADLLAPYLRKPTLVVGKSTVPVGTAARIGARLAAIAPAGGDVQVAWNPEFLREGHAIEDTLHPDRLVYGVATGGTAVEVLDEVYAGPLAGGMPRLVTDLATSELVKAAANSFLATKISFINAMSEVCEAAGADVVALADAIGYDDRIGRKMLGSGVGFGGGCLPKDLRAFQHRAGELGVEDLMSLLGQADAINQHQRDRAGQIASSMIGGRLAGARIAVWGAAFKPGTDDVRDSPALTIAGQLHLRGAEVTI